MGIHRYLAMTAGEFLSGVPLPEKIAWMACHFSPYTTGLSNLPDRLPPGSLLILNDRTPIAGHDPRSVAYQLEDCLAVWGCTGVLLDFQRAGNEETSRLVPYLLEALPCPAAVSEPYAKGKDCPVFLPPVPLHTAPRDWFAPWQGREIWLELAAGGEIITVTEEGSKISPAPGDFSGGWQEERLHCHCLMEEKAQEVRFHLKRTKEDLEALLTEAEAFGVTTAVGLYQEFPMG